MVFNMKKEYYYRYIALNLVHCIYPTVGKFNFELKNKYIITIMYNSIYFSSQFDSYNSLQPCEHILPNMKYFQIHSEPTSNRIPTNKMVYFIMPNNTRQKYFLPTVIYNDGCIDINIR